MAISSRAARAMGLAVLGAAALVGVSRGQGDGAVQKTSGGSTAPTTKFVPAVVGSIDLEAVFRGYEKSKFHVEQLKAEGMAKEGQLRNFIAQAKEIGKEMEALQPGSKDFQDRSAKLTELKAKLEATKETAQREGQAKYAEIMATFYKEVQAMTKNVADYKGITYVIRVSSEPIDSLDPEGVMAAMARPVVYSSPATDITTTVLWNLNQQYSKTGGPVVKTPAGAATTDENAKPAAATRTAAPRTPARSAAPPARTAAPRGRQVETQGEK